MTRATLVAFTLPATLVVAGTVLLSRSTDRAPSDDGASGALASLGEASSPREELAPSEGPRIEPTYKTLGHTYCQLAFGEDGSERRWLVLAPPTLYVDLNGDGDLTEETEAITETAGPETSHADFSMRLRAGECKLRHQLSAGGRSVLAFVSPEGHEWGAWGDEQGPLRFASSPGEAPVVHFGGRLQMGFETRGAVLHAADGSYHVKAGVGAYGRGPGSFAHLKIKWVPESALPIAVVSYAKADLSLGHVTVPLRQRC